MNSVGSTRGGQARGDQRREALLAALDDLLVDYEGSLEDISIGQVSERAGVTRSAFYFYFDNKQVAVAALVDEMYADALAAGAQLGGDAGPRGNIEATIRALFEAWDRHKHLYRAMLSARATHLAVQKAWDTDRESFIPIVADLIRSERERGEAAEGPEPPILAAVLLELNDRILERLARGSAHDVEELIDACVTVWHRSIYGTQETN